MVKLKHNHKGHLQILKHDSLHSSDITYKERHPFILKIDQKVKVKIIKVDPENRVSVGMKQPRRSLEYAKITKVNDKVNGVVTNVTDYEYQIENGIEGLWQKIC